VKISAIGLQAMDWLAAGQKVKQTWIEQANHILEKAKEPCGQTELKVVTAIEKLVVEVGKLGGEE